MIGKKINQLATELAPVSTDLTIIGDPVTGVSKKITLAQLGAIFSGAVSFYNDLASFPATGDINVIYCAKDTKKLYLWSGSAYVEVFPSQALLDTYQLRSEKGVSNGYASLDSGGKVPISQLPSSIMEYKGMWNAATNTPTLANGTGDTGDVYICNAAGTVNFGAGPITFAVGDYVIYSGSIWQRSSGAVGTVTSVAATITGDAIGITGSPVTTSGTLALAFAGTSAQYINGAGSLTTFPTSLISGTGNVNAIPKFTANTVLGNSVMEDDGNFVSMRGLKLNASAGVGNTLNLQQASSITAAGLGYSTIGAAGSTGIQFYLDQNVTERTFVLDTSTITSNTARTYSMPNSNGTLALTSDIPSLTGYVPYTGATANVDLGTHTLSAKDLVINHSSGSGVAASITKGGAGEALTVVKSSGSGNAASITGGVTLLDELHLNTDLADTYIASASNWNDAYNLRHNAVTLGTANGLSLSTQVLSLALASGSTTGALSSTDWTTFNNKTSNTGTVTSVGLSSATSGVTIGSTPITTSGTITLAIATASGSQQGLLSSTDWTTFNNKQNALTNPVTGTGTTNYLPKFTGTSTIGNSIISEEGGYLITVAGSSRFTGFDPGYYNENVLAIGNGTNNPKIGLASTSGYRWNTRIKDVGGNGEYVIRYEEGSLDALIINRSGNLGLGVTPSAWFSGTKALQINGGSMYAANTYTFIGSNIVYTDAGDKYINTGFATVYGQLSGEHRWYNAPSGTAGNAISFTQAMTLDASGNLMVGTTSPVTFSGYKTISLNGTSGGSFVTMANGTSAIRLISSTTDSALWEPRNVDMLFATNNTTRLTIASTGAATFSSSVTANSLRVNNNSNLIGDGRKIFGNDDAANYYIGDIGGTGGLTINWYGGIIMRTLDTERMRITSGGEVCIGRTTAYSAGFLLNVEGNIYASAALNVGTTIQTGTPSSGSAHAWKLGSYAAGGTGTATGVIYIEVNGQIYSIPALLGTP